MAMVLPNPQHAQRTDVKRRQHIIHRDPPAAGQLLALANGEGFGDIKKPEQDKNQGSAPPILPTEKAFRLRQMAAPKPITRHPPQKTKWHGSNLIHDD